MMEPGFFFFLWICMGVIGTFLGGTVNKWVAGFLLGFLLGPIGWIIVFLLPRETSHSRQTQTPTPTQTQKPKKRLTRDLSSDEYKVMLGKKYEISRNELFDQFECDGKLFESLDDALKYADELEAKAVEAEIEAEMQRERNKVLIPFEEIKADLLEKNIKVSLPLTGAYKAIDERGVVHRFNNWPELLAYYRKVMNK